MLDDKKIKELNSRVKKALDSSTIKVKQKSKQEHLAFFLENGQNSLETAKLLLNIASNTKLRVQLNFQDQNPSLWIINASYYSMFYFARALFEKHGIKLKTDYSIHLLTFDVLFHFFYLTGKLQKKFIDDFVEAEGEASELLSQEKAKALVEDYYHEKGKRAKFTYELGAGAMENKAKTSLERARQFAIHISQMVR